jgi:hypothetical protein
VGESQCGGDGDRLERASFFAAVAPVGLPDQYRDLPPGQALKLVLAGFSYDEDVVGVLVLDEELGVVALGVHHVRGDHAPGEVEVGQQRQEPADLVDLAVDIDLAEDGGGLVVQDCHQVHGLPVGAGVAGAPYRLAVHGQRHPPPRQLPPLPGWRSPAKIAAPRAPYRAPRRRLLPGPGGWWPHQEARTAGSADHSGSRAWQGRTAARPRPTPRLPRTTASRPGPRRSQPPAASTANDGHPADQVD